MKNVVECYKEFFGYFNFLETNGVGYLTQYLFLMLILIWKSIGTIYIIGQILLIQKLPGELAMAFITASSSLPI